MDEVKDIRDKAEAMAAYARQAMDSELIQYATEIKVRAEMRCGELLLVADKNTVARMNGTSIDGASVVERCDRKAPTLADMGLTRDESSRYQQLAAMPAEHFETVEIAAKAKAGGVTPAILLRVAKRAPTKSKAGRPASLSPMAPSVGMHHATCQRADQPNVPVASVAHCATMTSALKADVMNHAGLPQ